MLLNPVCRQVITRETKTFEIPGIIHCLKKMSIPKGGPYKPKNKGYFELFGLYVPPSCLKK